MESVDKKPIVTCDICGLRVPRTKLKNHQAQCSYHSNRGPARTFNCGEPDCSASFTSKCRLAYHIRNVHYGWVACPVPGCESKLKKGSITKHVKSVHEKLEQQCASCGRKFAYGQLRQHERNSVSCSFGNVRDPEFRCSFEDCRMTFKKASERTKHVAESHVRLTTCPLPGCGTVVKESYLSTHLRMVHVKEVRKCGFCGKEVSPHSLIQHLKICNTDKSERPFKCGKEGCGATFKTSAEVASHSAKVHTKPVRCPFPVCGAVMQEASMQRHIKRVHQKIAEECHKCGQKFAYGHLSGHLKLCQNDGPKLYKCEKEGCQSTFKTSAQRSSHVSKVHRTVNCPVPDCGIVCNAGCLRVHVQQVHEKCKQECVYCGMVMAYGNFSRHKKRCKVLMKKEEEV